MNAPERRLGVVMDPIERINPKKDSTLAMLIAAKERGWHIVYLEQHDVSIRDGVALGRGRYADVHDDTSSWYLLGEPWSGDLAELDVVLMRKDPPFDMEYIYTTYCLQIAENHGVLVVNRPASLRDINEKAHTARFPECTPPSLITRSKSDLVAFLREYKKVVFKPLDGMGGRSVFVISEGDINTNVVIETLTDDGERFIIAQRYVPEIADGDKRILLIEGEPVEFALARIPAAGESRGNLVLGATGEGRELTDRDRWICEQVGPALRDAGVMFAGLDVIGEYLTEINVTSPTGIRELDRQFGISIAGRLMDAIEARLASRNPA